MIKKNNIPRHIAFIMDGNGRWAQGKGLSRAAGHRAGVARVKEIVKSCLELGVEVVTFFAFSTENWDRPKAEINLLMRFFDSYLGREIKNLHKNNIRFKLIGRNQPIPKYLLDKIKDSQNLTAGNTGLVMVLALNYGARQEIVDAAKKIAESIIKGQFGIGDLNEEEFSRHLYTAGIIEPDLLIRTSGEMRLSNFLLWQLSYAELYFPKIYWPDFDKKQLEKAIKIYQRRERRFGRINVNKKNN